MHRSLRIVSLALASLLVAATAFAQTDLIISEYVEGSSNNKALELFNPTGAAIDMGVGLYKVQTFSNGSPTASATITLTGVLASGARYVIANTAAAPAILGVANLTSGSLNHNGDDAIALVKGAGNTNVDVLGQIGFDPGTEWGTLLQSTADNTIRRKSLVCDGDTNGADLFDPSIQWDGFANDTFDGLGQHTVGCGPTPALPSTWGSIKLLYR